MCYANNPDVWDEFSVIQVYALHKWKLEDSHMALNTDIDSIIAVSKAVE